ncbi:hypothetical protein [Neptuniibacter sp. QD37_11]|uniref:hypothetical protein n=1 Tax=Neptuniibacter sp. QD37_11 TaxID=3398209 RepID=UPI0039F4A51A
MRLLAAICLFYAMSASAVQTKDRCENCFLLEAILMEVSQEYGLEFSIGTTAGLSHPNYTPSIIYPKVSSNRDPHPMEILKDIGIQSNKYHRIEVYMLEGKINRIILDYIHPDN